MYKQTPFCGVHAWRRTRATPEDATPEDATPEDAMSAPPGSMDTTADGQTVDVAALDSPDGLETAPDGQTAKVADVAAITRLPPELKGQIVAYVANGGGDARPPRPPGDEGAAAAYRSVASLSEVSKEWNGLVKRAWPPGIVARAKMALRQVWREEHLEFGQDPLGYSTSDPGGRSGEVVPASAGIRLHEQPGSTPLSQYNIAEYIRPEERGRVLRAEFETFAYSRASPTDEAKEAELLRALCVFPHLQDITVAGTHLTGSFARGLAACACRDELCVIQFDETSVLDEDMAYLVHRCRYLYDVNYTYHTTQARPRPFGAAGAAAQAAMITDLYTHAHDNPDRHGAYPGTVKFQTDNLAIYSPETLHETIPYFAWPRTMQHDVLAPWLAGRNSALYVKCTSADERLCAPVLLALGGLLRMHVLLKQGFFFDGWPGLTDALLGTFLDMCSGDEGGTAQHRASGPRTQVKMLCLHDCPKLTPAAFATVVTCCPELEVLSLQGVDAEAWTGAIADWCNAVVASASRVHPLRLVLFFDCSGAIDRTKFSERSGASADTAVLREFQTGYQMSGDGTVEFLQLSNCGGGAA